MTHRTRTPGLLLAVVTAVLAVVTTATPVLAHAELVGSNPREGATVPTMPGSVTLTFSEPVRTPAFVEVTDAAGDDVARGPVQIVDADLSRGVGPVSQGGAYAVSYRVTSSDGHPISGTVRFSVAGGTGQSGDRNGAATSSGTSGSGGLGGGELALLLGALLVGLVALGIGTRRALRHSVAMVEQGRPEGRSRRP